MVFHQDVLDLSFLPHFKEFKSTKLSFILANKRSDPLITELWQSLLTQDVPVAVFDALSAAKAFCI